MTSKDLTPRNCFFVSDLHGQISRYETLWRLIRQEQPDSLFIAGDILPSYLSVLKKMPLNHENFIPDFLVPQLYRLQKEMADRYPSIFIIMGNDDGRKEESSMLAAEAKGLWNYCHYQSINWSGYTIYGYSYIPPSPFRLKDWERYDVSRYVDPGCIAPPDGNFTVALDPHQLEFATIAQDLEQLSDGTDFERAVFLFHSPPYKCNLDRAALDEKMIDYVPVDVHVGSIAIQRFIDHYQPLLTLHGHIHESTRLTGSWRHRFGKTHSFNAAHDGSELSLIRFNPADLGAAERNLL